MSKWKTNLKKVLAGASLLLMTFSTVSAYDGYSSCYDPCCGPCYNSCDCGGFNVGVDFLYWKPCVDDLTYAAVATIAVDEDSPSPVAGDICVRYKDICAKWEPGVRIMASVPNLLSCWDAMASFTYLNSCSKDSCCVCPFGSDVNENLEGDGFIVSPLVHPLVALAGEGFYDCAKGKWKSTYYNADLLLAYNISLNPCLNIKPYFGVAGIYLEQNTCFAGFSTLIFEEFDTCCPNVLVDWCTDYWGVGLKIGSQFEQTLCNCFSIFANGSASLLAGHTNKSNNTQAFLIDSGTSTPAGLTFGRQCSDGCDDSCNPCDCDCEYGSITFKNDDRCLFVPGYHIQAGFKYASNMCGCNYALRLGYEFLNWHNVPNPRVFSTSSFPALEVSLLSLANSSSPNTRTYGFHGLFAGLEFGF